MRTSKSSEGGGIGPVNLITGGFPCQPFSQAGKRKGQDDDRYLWPEMLRVISETRPTWIVGENVAGIISMALDQVLYDLEDQGYEVQAFVIPACAVNAPHRRDRVWIIAHSAITTNRRRTGKIPETNEFEKNKGQKMGISKFSKSDQIFKDSVSKRSRRRGKDRRQILECKVSEVKIKGPDCEGYDRYPNCHNVQGNRKKQDSKKQDRLCDRENEEWRKDWFEVATDLCGVDDGIPVELDGFKLSKAKNREERLKALGNAIVPQVAIEIFKAIKKYEETANSPVSRI